MAKTFNTRLKLRFDTYEAWTTADPVLLKGEVAIVSIPAATGAVSQEPSILMKVGDGVKKFSELGFISGLSADVHTWAKAADKPTYTADEISGLSAYISGKVQDTDTQYTIRKVNDYQYQLQSKALGDASFSDVADAVINIPNDTEAITALQTLVGTDSVATQIAAAITALDLANTYDAKGAAASALTEAKSYADGKDTAMNTRVEALESKFGDGDESVATQIAAAVAAEKTRAETAEQANATAAAAAQTAAETADGKAVAEATRATAKEAELETAIGTKAAQTDVDALTTKVSTLIGEDASKSVRTIANEELAAQLIPATASESLDTLQEIAAWIQAHPGDASAMNQKIATLETAVGEGGSVGTQIDTKIAALKLDETYEPIGAETRAKAYADTEIAKLHTFTNQDTLDTLTDTQVASLENKIEVIKVNGTEQTITDKAVDITVPTTINELGQDANEELILDCGGAANA